jgi:hypothetical protein
VVLAAAAAAVGIALGAACLPDLDAVVTSTGPAPTSVCGDGVIDLDAGEECDPGEAGAAVGCGACKVECAGGSIDRATGHCYYAAARAASIAAAVTACRDAGGHVTTFASETEMGFVADASPSDDFWVGISRSPFLGPSAYAPPSGSIEPGWSPSCAGCYAHIPADSGAIPGDPSVGTGDCILARKNAALPWVQVACESPSTPRGTICEREPPGSRSVFCIGGVCFDVPATAGIKRYLLVPNAVRADDARGSCETAEGTLVAFDSREEREQVAREVALPRVAAAVDSFWIGLATGGDGGPWAWEGDASTALLPWGEREPVLPGGRAFVRIVPTTTDSELAHAAGPDEVHPVLCQIPIR